MATLSKVPRPKTNILKAQRGASVNKDNTLALIAKIFVRDESKTNYNYPLPHFKQMAMEARSKTLPAEDILAIFPDSELAIEMITSSILNPNDMRTVNFIYNFPDIELPTAIKAEITEMIRSYIDTNYKIEDNIKNMIKKAKFLDGSYINIIIPEASFNDMIYNGVTTESYKEERSQRVIGTYISKEDYQPSSEFLKVLKSKSEEASSKENIDKVLKLKDFVTVTDDFTSIVSKEDYIKATNKDRYKQATGYGREEHYTLNIDRLFRTRHKVPKEEFIALKSKNDASRKSIGKPLFIKVPSESIIPIYPKGEPNNHVGYFLLCDDRGLPLSLGKNDLSGSMDIVTSNSQTISGNQLQRGNDAINNNYTRVSEFQDMEQLFSDLMEDQIKTKLKKGAYSDLLNFSTFQSINRIMFSRALEAKETKLIYLPVDMVSYFAYDFRANGTGKSLLEDCSTLYSIRSALFFSKVMGIIRNNIPIKKVTVTPNEDDPDPYGTFEVAKEITLSERKNILPFGKIDVASMTDWLNSMGLQFNLESEKVPVKIDVEDTQSDVKLPDVESDEAINALILNKFGLTPELLKPGMDPEFATSLVTRNLLFANRIEEEQKATSVLLTNLVRKIIKNDRVLGEDIESVLKEKMKDVIEYLKANEVNSETDIDSLNQEQVINYIIDTIEEEFYISLPEVTMQDAGANFNALKYYEEMVNTTLEKIFNTDVFATELVGELGNNIEQAKAVLTQQLLVKFILDNDILPDLRDIISNPDGEGTIFDDGYQHMENILNSLVKFKGKIVPNIAKFNLAASKLEELMNKAQEAAGGDDNQDDDGYGDNGTNDDSSEDDNSDTNNDNDMDGGNDGDMDGDEGNEVSDSDDFAGDGGSDDDFSLDGGDDLGDDAGGDTSGKGEKKNPLEDKLLKARIKTEEAQALKNVAETKAKLKRGKIEDPELEKKADDIVQDTNVDGKGKKDELADGEFGVDDNNLPDGETGEEDNTPDE